MTGKEIVESHFRMDAIAIREESTNLPAVLPMVRRSATYTLTDLWWDWRNNHITVGKDEDGTPIIMLLEEE
jgi:hypothetical protein